MEHHYHQQTLAQPVTCAGIGVHSGKHSRIIIQPAPVNHGIRFRRLDLPGTPDIPALFKTVVDTSLATVVGRDGAIVSTIEHLMAAFSGLAIDNALVEINGYEMPIMDGSAETFAREISRAGIHRQDSLRWYFVMTRQIRIEDGDKFVEIVPGKGFTINCTIEFDHPLIGRQEISFDPVHEDFHKEISPARTFGFLQDLEYLKRFSLGRGGSLDTAVVIDKDTILNPGGLRFPDEFVRHKLLDSLGDFSLLGMPIQGHITTYKSGHALNHAFIKELLAQKDAWETRTVAVEDLPRP
ncbi:LpxC [Desulforapulum autotrophicum HRM2]|uniref:UDP-3-O-acyl-N-acetylglucosamine deacetylase n=1 Tax=Desulforapulum autotrophicum (strain ATCC 43914 / DSM 3382 / VKM B-1955 / HRM2) TaxID=177437 RepID=C0QLE5_DESAH|nr:UDP-3-O-acyl-N-acetylglucosamine deacetylase [Desulforapulum autotrophicum]ACN14231.1 LpxC [Desulforapulum autotrophicum HRM2]